MAVMETKSMTKRGGPLGPRRGDRKTRFVGGRLVTPAELQKTHRYIIDTEVIVEISDERRAVIVAWPELFHKLPPAEIIPRGRYIGKRVGDPPKSDAEHFIRCPACGGWIDCRDLGQVFEHEGPSPHPGAGSAAMNEGVQFEILVDGKPQSYGALKDVAIASAELIKSHNPLSEVAVRDKKTGEITPVSYTPGII